jgi:dCMP deaminase
VISANEVLTRPNWEQWGLDLAEAVSKRADCSRRQVGAVIMTRDHTIVATGYNGSPPGGPSCLRGECPRGRSDVAPGTSYDTGAGACIALHAEQNALLRASWDEMKDSTLYCNHEPCEGCVRMICGTPLDRVIWPLAEGEPRGRVGYALHHVARIRAGRFERIQ